MTTKEYFEKRALLTEKYSKQRGEKYLEDLEKAYILLDKQIKDDIKKFYKKYSDNIETIDRRLHEALDKNDIKDYNKDINSILSQSSLSEEDKKILRDNYIKYKLSRLLSLKKQIELRLKILTREYELSSVKFLKENYKEVYAQSAYDLIALENIDINISFKTFDDRLIEKIVREKWSNKSYSSRIWGHYRKLEKEIENTLISGMGLGYSVDKMSKRLEDRTKVNFSNCKRLIRTESNRMLSEATNDLYKDAGLEKYQFLATLDYKTSEICQSLDNKIFNVKNRKIGVNSNPMHPNCRSTTIPYLEEYMDEEIRIARDPITNKSYYVPAKHNYKKWYENMIERQKKSFELNKIKHKNKSKDKKSYEKYRKILGKNAPKTIDEFQEIKYNDDIKYSLIKMDYSRRNRLFKNPSLILPNIDKATIDDRKFTEYLFGGKNEQGLNKGRLITDKLGYDINNYKEFKKEILEKAKLYPAKFKGDNPYGKRYEQKIFFYNNQEFPINVIVAWQTIGNNVHMSTIYLKELQNES